MDGHERIFVALEDEGTKVWRPVHAQHLQGNVYLIVKQQYDRDVESWQFEPGDRVYCQMIDSSDGPILAATSKA